MSREEHKETYPEEQVFGEGWRDDWIGIQGGVAKQ